MHKNSGKNISKTLSVKHSQQLIDHAEQSATDVLKTTSRREIKKNKTAEATGFLIGNKIANRTTQVPKLHKRTS